MLDQKVEDFIREDESENHDEDVVCSCDHCGKDIRVGQDMMVFLNVNGESARLCEDCVQWIDADTLAEMLGIWVMTDDAYSAQAALTTQTVEQKRRSAQ